MSSTGEPPRSAHSAPPVPMQACCCPARPKVKVVMPPAPGRPHPVDLWLCGHHYRVSRQALAAAGAHVYDLAQATAGPGSVGTAAGTTPRAAA